MRDGVDLNHFGPGQELVVGPSDHGIELLDLLKLTSATVAFSGKILVHGVTFKIIPCCL
jgi:hypothetical protein